MPIAKAFTNAFDMKPEDPTHYRLVINTDFATAPLAASIITHACKEAISPAEEQEGLKRISELLLGQRIVNVIAFKEELPIYFWMRKFPIRRLCCTELRIPLHVSTERLK